MQQTPSKQSIANTNDIVVRGLRDGIMLEDSNTLLSWRSDWSTLQTAGAPDYTNEKNACQLMQWNKRKCFGGLECSLIWQPGQFSDERLFTRVRIVLPTHPAQNHVEAAEEFHESIDLLQTAFGRPGRLQNRTALPNISLSGNAEWHYPDFKITHTLTTPWDGFSNATFISVERRSFLQKLMLGLRRHCT